MRIISGKFKGKKILEPNDLNTRPLKDLTKESIFNIIKHSNRFNINFENSEIFFAIRTNTNLNPSLSANLISCRRHSVVLLQEYLYCIVEKNIFHDFKNSEIFFSIRTNIILNPLQICWQI